MKLLLGSLLLAGVCWLGAAVTVPIMENFNSQRIAKTWYPLLSIPTGSTRSVDFPRFRFLAQRNGNLKYRIRVPENGRCTTKDLELIKEGQPGNYISTAPSTLQFVETDYNTYFIAYITRGADKADAFLALSGNRRTLTPALRTKFWTTANSLGITGEMLQSVLQETC